MNPRQRLALIAAAVVILVGGFIVANKSSDDDSGPATTSAAGTAAQSSTGDGATTTQAPAQPAIHTGVLSGGKPQGGIKKLSFKKGDDAKFKITSDVSDEIHVHGYDLMKDVKAGGSV